MKSYDQTERRFDRKASFVEKLQETDGLSFSRYGILETSISHQSEVARSKQNAQICIAKYVENPT